MAVRFLLLVFIASVVAANGDDSSSIEAQIAALEAEVTKDKQQAKDVQAQKEKEKEEQEQKEKEKQAREQKMQQEAREKEKEKEAQQQRLKELLRERQAAAEELKGARAGENVQNPVMKENYHENGKQQPQMGQWQHFLPQNFRHFIDRNKTQEDLKSAPLLKQPGPQSWLNFVPEQFRFKNKDEQPDEQPDDAKDGTDLSAVDSTSNVDSTTGGEAVATFTMISSLTIVAALAALTAYQIKRKVVAVAVEEPLLA